MIPAILKPLTEGLHEVDEIAEGMHGFEILGGNGDTKLQWDPAVPAEVASAKTTFDGLKSKGYHAFGVKKGGEPADRIMEFDPTVGQMILMPRMAGG